MAYPSLQLIVAFRNAADQLRKGAHYAWGHHGACNCGHLVQSLTGWSETEILQQAHQGIGEWSELGLDYCSSSPAPLHSLFSRLEQAGLSPTDLHSIECLDDREVLNQLPGGFRWLKKNLREDVILYFETYASLLEDQLISFLDIEFLFTSNDQRQLSAV